MFLGVALGWAAAAAGGDPGPEEGEEASSDALRSARPDRAAGRGHNRWAVGPEIYRYEYEESGLMDLEGVLYGLAVQVTHWGAADAWPARPRWRPRALRAEGRLAVGSHDYDGMLMDGTPYQVSGMDALSREGRLLIGWGRPRPDRSTTLFLGLGYRYKEDDSGDRAGYRRQSTYRYLPVALEHQRRLAGDRSLAWTIEYDRFLSGEQVSDFSRFGAGRINNEQRSGFGVRASTAYVWTSARAAWSVEPFVRYWKIGDSERVVLRAPPIVIEFMEPANTTLEAGLSVSLRF